MEVRLGLNGREFAAGRSGAAATANERAREILARAIASRTFTKRQLSWTAISDGYFLKIARRSDDPEQDMVDPGAQREIEEEFRLTTLLSSLTDDVLPPIAELPGCLVARAIDGIDLRDEIRLARDDVTGVNRRLGEAIRVCAAIHAGTARVDGELSVHDYRADPFLPAPREIVEIARGRPARVVCRGLEVRNFIRDRATGRLRFIDPHEVVLGMPEEDVTRFVVSVLMLRWGRPHFGMPWTRFSLQSVLGAYRECGLSLDPRLLDYAMRLNVEMRRHHAVLAARRTPLLLRPAALAYVRTFFSRLDRWSQANVV